MTVCCLEVPVAEAAKTFGVMEVDESGRVIGFQEKPEHPAEIPGKPGFALASMGNYVFDTEFLYERLLEDAVVGSSTHDFGHDVIPALIEQYHVQAYPFRNRDTGEKAYWRDVGTLDSFWQANMELISTTPQLNLYEEEWPLWTYQEQLPPAKFVFNDSERRGMALQSMVAGGCIISGSTVSNSVVFSGTHVHSYSEISGSVILPDVVVERRVQLKDTIIDRGCVIPEGSRIGFDAAEDKANGFRVSTGGVTLVTRGMLGQAEGTL
jgi:glucose-1-phosphate adenylyltransferase